jgi:hypothetical protein
MDFATGWDGLAADDSMYSLNSSHYSSGQNSFMFWRSVLGLQPLWQASQQLWKPFL